MSRIYPLLGRFRHPLLTLRPTYGYDIHDEILSLTNQANSLLSNFFEVAEARPDSSRCHLTEKGFEVKLDVTGFKPDELDVKLVDNSIVIKGEHEEKQDEHGYISRSFARRYVLPESVKPESVNCTLSSDGFLLLNAPVVDAAQAANERPIPIMQSGQPAPAVKSYDQAKKQSKDGDAQ